MKKTTVFVVAVLVALCANSSFLHAQDESPTSIKGKLDRNDPPDPFLKKVSQGKLVSPHKVHVLKFEANKVYVIDLKSGDFDAFLRVEDAKGKQLTADDDGGVELDSRALFTAPKKGSYRVVVSSLDGVPGNYALSVSSAPGKLLFGRSGILLQRSDIQNVKLEKGKTYVINMTSAIQKFDPLLRVQDASGKQLAEDDDGGEGFNSRLRFTAPESASYQIVATTYKGQGKGPYQLTIEEAK